MHILHLIKTSEGAGWAFDIINSLTETYDNVTFSVVIPPGGKHFEKYKDVCRDVYEFSFALDTKLLSRGIKFRTIVKKDNPDIIHSWFTQTTLYARLFLRDIKIPRLFQVVGPFHMEKFIYRNLDIFSAQRNDFWNPTAQITYDLYRKMGVAHSKLFLSYITHLDNYETSFNSSKVFNLRQIYNIPSGSKIIGTCSMIYPPLFLMKRGIKNHELLLEVFEKILQKRNDIYCIIGGKTFGNNTMYEEKLKRKAAQIDKNKIIFTGFVPNLGRLITELDVFIFLSLSENHGGVFESLLFKVPTVSSNKGGIPELVIDGETGFTCNLNSIDEVVEKIELILDNPQVGEAFKSKGYNRVKEIFNREKSITRSYEIYREILNKNA
jgi:glycosyltransferase involved in cell wall biosynthesis